MGCLFYTKIMDIDNYIDWVSIWSDKAQLNDLDLDEESEKVLIQFKNDPDVELLSSECNIDENDICICFGEEGGKSEGDSQGWSKEYYFTLDHDFIITNIEYQQG